MHVLLCFKFMLLQITYCLLSLQGMRRRQGEVVLTVPEGAPGAVHCWGAGVEAAWSTPDLSDSFPPGLCLVAQSCLTLCGPMDCSLPGSSVHGDSPGKNTGVDCHALLQGIFPTQGLNPGLPHCRQILYCLSYQESPRIL